MRSNRFLQLIVILFVLFVNSVPNITSSANPPPTLRAAHSTTENGIDLTGIRVGIYEGYYRSEASRTALISMFEWMNATVNVFNSTDIINGSLWSCELFAIPEGLGPTLESRLTPDGLQAIREWVAAGGSYIGVRGSAAMAVRYSYFEGSYTEFNLALIEGTSYEITEMEPLEMTNVSINRACVGPDLSEMPSNLSVLFETGRYILPAEGQELIFIANYTHVGLPAMVASYYGEGTVFISSPHFEYEEDGDRDGTEYYDRYDDPDSEWPFMLTISRWLIESSPTVCNITEWPYTPSTTPEENLKFPFEILLVGGGVGIAVILVIAIYIRRK